MLSIWFRESPCWLGSSIRKTGHKLPVPEFLSGAGFLCHKWSGQQSLVRCHDDDNLSYRQTPRLSLT
jgi:hypothetical protein